MCGIAGIVNFSEESSSDQQNLRLMRDCMSRRGPDGSGEWTSEDRKVIFGHRRLAIIDLSSSGAQPMSNEDGRIWITYNGEIYNYQALRSELVFSGHDFKSNSDTEVIIHGYEQWGIDGLLLRLCGMFAFAIYDSRHDDKLKGSKVILVRDPSGIKPLYYVTQDAKMLFASEVRAFKAFDPDWKENPDWRIYLLTFGHIPEPFTVLEGLRMLKKGSYISFDLASQKATEKIYNEYKFSEEISDFDDAAKGVRRNIEESVKEHLISDAPIGVFLSGGIDSSLIALISARHTKDLRTLSAVFEEESFSEERYQKIISEMTGSRHRSCKVKEEDFRDSIEDIFAAMDQPTVDGINSYFIAKAAKEDGLKAVLSGIGGDEIFGGYPSFRRISKLRQLDRLGLSGFPIPEGLIPERYNKLSFLGLKRPINYYLSLRGLYTIASISELLDAEKDDIKRALDKIQPDFESALSSGNLASFLETDLYMKNQLLRDTDFMSMWHSVEVRVPFLDKRVMDFVSSVKDSVKFGGRMPKKLLISAFSDILPQEIYRRKKQGFTFPFDFWMKKDADLLSGSDSGLNKKAVSAFVTSFKHGRLHWSRFWALAVMGRYGRGIISHET